MRDRTQLAAFLHGFTPRSALTCSIEGETPPAGGAPPATPPAAPAPQPTPPAPAFTQADIDERVKKATDAVWKQAREHYEKPKPNGGQQQPKPETPPQPSSPPDAVAILQLRDDFDDAISDLSLTGSQKKFIRGLVMEKRPADVAAFVRETVEALGLKATSSPAATPGAPAPAAAVNPATPNALPVTSRATPPAASTPTDDVPILSMSEADKRALSAKIGDVKFAERMLKELARDNVKVRPRLL